MITDIEHTGQGDFSINYDIKDIEHNFFTNIYVIKDHIFNVFLRTDSVFVYDGLDDKFPQSFLFGKSSKIKVIENNMTSDFLVLYRQQNSIHLSNYYVASSANCPSIDTYKDITNLTFSVVPLSDGTKDYAQYINGLLNIYGKPDSAKELVIFISDPSSGTRLIYDKSQPIKSGKLTCMIKSIIGTNSPDAAVENIPDDGSVDSIQAFSDNKDKYNYWIIISSNMTKEDLGSDIKNALITYYGG